MQAQRSAKALVLVAILAFAPVAAFAADAPAKAQPVKAAAADPNAFVDMSLVKEVEASGFIKQLYKK